MYGNVAFIELLQRGLIDRTSYLIKKQNITSTQKSSSGPFPATTPSQGWLPS